MKIALILGITGQDGSYLSELLLKKNYKVWGVVRRSSNFNTQRIEHIRDRITLKYGDITDYSCLVNILLEINKQDFDVLEIYNLAAQSHVKISFEMPHYTSQVDGIGTLNILEAIRTSQYMDKIKFYQASTSEMFGKVQEVPQKETTPFYPRSPYGVAKLYGYWMVNNYKESYNLYACNGILFNHSSPRRPENFILRKITNGVIKGLTDESFVLLLGNLEAQRDIGFAKDYCYGMWLMLQQDIPDNYVLATNTTHSIRQLVEKAYKQVGIKIIWSGEGINECGYNRETNRMLVSIDEKYFRPCEVDLLIGDYSKAKDILGWEPKTNINDLISNMIEYDLLL